MEFDIFTGEDSVHPALCGPISRLRKVRLPTQQQASMLFGLVGGSTPSEDGKRLVFKNLECTFIGAVNYDCFKLGFLDSALGCDRITKAYNMDVAQGHHRAVNSKGVPCGKERWLQKQWETYEFSPYGMLKDKPVDVSHNPDEYCMAYIDDSKIVPGPTDAWDEFLSQFKKPVMIPVFKAFLWAAFDPLNDGRQLLYLYDPDGYTGKGRVVGAVMSSVPQISVAINAESLKNRFFVSQLFGKRLLFYPDCKNTKILHYEVIHSLTGGDYMPVEFKFQQGFTLKMYMRCLIMSNDPPSVSRYRKHEMSRIIIIEMDSKMCTSKKHKSDSGDNIGDSSYGARLKSQFWHFLYTCREDYEKLCPNHCDILIPKDSFESISSDYEAEFEDLLKDYEITKNDADMVPVTDIYRLFFDKNKDQKFSSNTKHELSVFLGYKGVKNKRSFKGEGGYFFTGIKERVGFSGTFTSNNSNFDEVKYS